jgi:hypothetical protein
VPLLGDLGGNSLIEGVDGLGGDPPGGGDLLGECGEFLAEGGLECGELLAVPIWCEGLGKVVDRLLNLRLRLLTQHVVRAGARVEAHVVLVVITPADLDGLGRGVQG